MTAYEEHLLLRKELKRANLISNVIVAAILILVFAINYMRVYGG